MLLKKKLYFFFFLSQHFFNPLPFLLFFNTQELTILTSLFCFRFVVTFFYSLLPLFLRGKGMENGAGFFLIFFSPRQNARMLLALFCLCRRSLFKAAARGSKEKENGIVFLSSFVLVAALQCAREFSDAPCCCETRK